MNGSRRWVLEGSLACAMTLAACGGRIREPVEPPSFTAHAAEFASADGTGMTLRLQLDAYNPNPVPLYAREIDGTMSIAGQPVAMARVTFDRMLPPQQPLPIVANITLPRNGPSAAGLPAMLAAGPAQVPFTVTGTIQIVAERRHAQFQVPFNVQGAVAREMLLGVPAMAQPVIAPAPAAAPQMVGGPANVY